MLRGWSTVAIYLVLKSNSRFSLFLWGIFFCQITLSKAECFIAYSFDRTTFHGLQNMVILGLVFSGSGSSTDSVLDMPFYCKQFNVSLEMYDSMWDTMTALNEVLYGHNSTLTLSFLAFVDFCHNLNIFQT